MPLSSRDCKTPQLAWDPLCQSSAYSASARPQVVVPQIAFSKSAARKNGETKRASASVLFSTRPRTTHWPLTAISVPYRPPPAHISVRSAYSTCPPRPQPVCQPALGLVDDDTHALASIVPPLRGRREDGRVLLLLSSYSSSSSSVSPYNVALRHCQTRRASHYERAARARHARHDSTRLAVNVLCSAV